MGNEIVELSFNFSLNIVELYRHLIANQEYVLSKQLLRAGTSTGANVSESQAAQSKADFIAKMSIAAKEARETEYWLKLLHRSGYLDGYADPDKVNGQIISIIKLLTKIIKTAQSS